MSPVPYLVACASLLAAASACAASGAIAPSPVWTQEPSNFLGIDLQGDFLQQVEECPAGIANPQTLCRVPTVDPASYEVRGLPYLPISPGYSLVANLENGKVSKLIFSGNANSLHLVSEMLTDRFGEPANQQSRWIKMSSGASFLTEVLQWKGERVNMDFQRQQDDLSRYAVTVAPVPMVTSETPEAADTEVGGAERETSKL